MTADVMNDGMLVRKEDALRVEKLLALLRDAILLGQTARLVEPPP
jgi:hypothetical protein